MNNRSHHYRQIAICNPCISTPPVSRALFHPHIPHYYPTVIFSLCPPHPEPKLRHKRVSHLSIHPNSLYDRPLLLPSRKPPWIPDLIPDWSGFATYTMTQFCLGSAVPCSPTPNFQPPPFDREPIQDRFGLLNTHSAKPSSPHPNFLGNFSNPFSHSDFDKVSPKGESLPWELSRQFTLPVSTALPYLLQSLDFIRPPEPHQNIGRFPPSRFNHRYRSKEPEVSGRTPHRNAYLSNT